jgi:hypothetical protein
MFRNLELSPVLLAGTLIGKLTYVLATEFVHFVKQFFLLRGRTQSWDGMGMAWTSGCDLYIQKKSKVCTFLNIAWASESAVALPRMCCVLLHNFGILDAQGLRNASAWKGICRCFYMGKKSGKCFCMVVASIWARSMGNVSKG